MNRSPELDLQLSHMAGHIDRKNRPLWIVIVPLCVLLLAAGYLAISFSARLSANRQLVSAWNFENSAQQWMQMIEAERARRKPETQKYVPNPYAGSSIEDFAKKIEGFDKTPTVNAPQERHIIFNEDITSKYVECRATQQPLDQIMLWFDRVLASELLDGVFISKIQLVPDPTVGWNVQVHFKWYERKL